MCSCYGSVSQHLKPHIHFLQFKQRCPDIPLLTHLFQLFWRAVRCFQSQFRKIIPLKYLLSTWTCLNSSTNTHPGNMMSDVTLSPREKPDTLRLYLQISPLVTTHSLCPQVGVGTRTIYNNLAFMLSSCFATKDQCNSNLTANAALICQSLLL